MTLDGGGGGGGGGPIYTAFRYPPRSYHAIRCIDLSLGLFKDLQK